MKLTLRAGKHVIDDPVSSLRRLQGTAPRLSAAPHMSDQSPSNPYTGGLYFDHLPSTPKDELALEDLGVTLLLSSRVAWRACLSILEMGSTLRGLSEIGNTPLEESTVEERNKVSSVISEVAGWNGFRVSVATKILHKKRPNLIPVLDNQAIFTAYMGAKPPERLGSAIETFKEDNRRVIEVLNSIQMDLISPANEDSWLALKAIEPNRTRVQLFDMVWWSWFPENVAPQPNKEPARKPRKL